MATQISLRLFLTCLVVCASLTLYGLWFGDGLGGTYFRINASTFIVGLASFLVWFTFTLRSLHTLVRGKKDHA